MRMALPPPWISLFQAAAPNLTRAQAQDTARALEKLGWRVVPAYAVDEERIPSGLTVDQPGEDDSPWGSANVAFCSPASCPCGPHRGPEGPNEDVDQCRACWSLSWCLRPEGETYGEHLPDCSLPERHESYCKPGGSGHPPSRSVRG